MVPREVRVRVSNRFCGPSACANGGYLAGILAQLAAATCAVRLAKPVPLESDLAVLDHGAGELELRCEDSVLATARPTELSLQARAAVTHVEAIEASRRFAGFRAHAAPQCFVCGPQRRRGDGLRIFAGPIPELGVVAAPWVPDSSLDRGDGKVRPEFMAAALDCPGYYAVSPQDHRLLLLAELTVHVDRIVHIDEACTVIGWALESSGRKHHAGTALYDEDGELCAAARALWIEPRAASSATEVTSVGT